MLISEYYIKILGARVSFDVDEVLLAVVRTIFNFEVQTGML